MSSLRSVTAALLLLPALARAQSSVTITQFFGFPSSGADGYLPEAPVLQASDGNLYGTAVHGGDDGSGCAVHSCFGTIFRLTPEGAFTRLYTFAYGSSSVPYDSGASPAGG